MTPDITPPDQEPDITYEHLSEEVTVVRLGSDPANHVLSVYTASVLRAASVDLTNQGRYRLVLDLRGLAFLDSTGLLVITAARRRARAQGGDLAVVLTDERLRKIFRITGLTNVFALHDTVERAVEDVVRKTRRL
ncbi:MULTISPECIES: anti-sigma factor antagonist [unclassified Streptomyces]|uniref:anti-sigma factor antagonist n=1 Tax=unclassified Streptomyces TaxID=2593676 RepID=UPI0038019D69